jgi:hypothetical protein
MLSLLRNPVLRLVGRFWWVPALGPFAGEGLGGQEGNLIATMGVEIYLGTVAVMVALACTHGAVDAVRWRASLRRLRHGYACPHCLQLGGFHFGCGACGEEIEEFPVLTKGVYVNDCPQCKARLFDRPGRSEGIVKAYCRNCGQTADRTIHHERTIRVLGTFLRDDFQTLSAAIRADAASGDEAVYAIHDDGGELTYVLNIGETLDKTVDIPREHILFHPDAIWCDKAALDPLRLGREVDRYISQPGMSEGRLKTTRICVARDSLDSATSRRLEAPFRMVSYGVPATEFTSFADGDFQPAVAFSPPETNPASAARDQQSDGPSQTLKG